MGPVSDGQFGPPKSSSSHTSKSIGLAKVVLFMNILAIVVVVDVSK